MRILVTGGCGFVGSTICIGLKEKYRNFEIIAFDNLKRRGSELNIPRLREHEVSFIHGDVRIASDFDRIDDISVIIDASAEPSVLAGIEGSTDYLIDTNFSGTINCLNLARKWKAKFIFLSTSRVYSIPQLEHVRYVEDETRFRLLADQNCAGASDNGFTEDFPTGGYRSLYGTTKLASELAIEEYHHLFGLDTIINRCGVLTGPYQMGKVDQGVVVLWMARHFWPKQLKYIGFGGTGKQVRDILHIDDLVSLIDFQLSNFDLFNGQVFNIGGGLEVSISLRELTAMCEEVTGNKIEIIGQPENRVADIPIYIADTTKVFRCAKWQPKKGVMEVLKDVFIWLSNDETRLKELLS